MIKYLFLLTLFFPSLKFSCEVISEKGIGEIVFCLDFNKISQKNKVESVEYDDNSWKVIELKEKDFYIIIEAYENNDIFRISTNNPKYKTEENIGVGSLGVELFKSKQKLDIPFYDDDEIIVRYINSNISFVFNNQGTLDIEEELSKMTIDNFIKKTLANKKIIKIIVSGYCE